MIFLAIVSNTKTVPAGSGLGKLGLITYTQFEFQDGSLGASSTRSIMGYGEDQLTIQQARNNVCIPVVMPYQTTAAKQGAGGVQASAASPVRTRISCLTSQEEIERFNPRDLCPSLELIYHSQTETPRQKNYLSSSCGAN
ncbi:hypothetical protein E5C31_01960 [Providencia rettgeri]|nr:hypothetical protein [Providencia rettgeri]